MCALKDRVMSFLIRSIFWLGLVFSALPWDGESLRADLSGEVEHATRALAGQAQAICAKDPIACALQAAALGKTFEAPPSQNTLRAADLGPAWRGPAIVTAHH
jgi:hypothetical protein